MVSKYCTLYLKKSDNPHILTLSPPLNMKPEWFGAHLGYTMAKYGMSMTVLGLADELKADGVGVNAL
jgi:citronellol/citronellal dehydrogenase